jgi:KDEL-tailed cysteine endopeptidase
LATNYAMTEKAYPYQGVDGTCQYSESEATKVLVSDWTTVTPSDVHEMKGALVEQPLSINLEASDVFKSYTSGILDDPACGNQHNHAVLAVGYGVSEEGIEYWVVKNSWGTDWGEDGYIRMAIVEGDGICGVQMHPLQPHVDV